MVYASYIFKDKTKSQRNKNSWKENLCSKKFSLYWKSREHKNRWQRRIIYWAKFHDNMFRSGGVKVGLQFGATEKLRLTCLNRVVIGDYVLLGSSVTIIDCNHGMNPEDIGGYAKQEMLLDEVCIENGVWCGDHVIILPGVTIGQHSIIGAGSIVTKSIPEYCIAAGNPAKVIKRWDFESRKWKKV